MKKLFFAVSLVLFVTLNADAETWIDNYGYYENKNEISAKDKLIGEVNNIFDFENGKNVGGEKIEQGRYYIETKYKGGYNGTDPDYIYLDEIVGKDGENGLDGQDGYTPVKGVDYFDGIDGQDGIDGKIGDKGDKGDTGKTGKNGNKGDRGLQGEQGRGLEDRYELIGEVRFLDTRKTTWSIYAGHDFNNDVNIFGAKCIIKLGRSYEERRLDKLEEKIRTLTEEKEMNSIEIVPYGNNGLKIKTNF